MTSLLRVEDVIERHVESAQYVLVARYRRFDGVDLGRCQGTHVSHIVAVSASFNWH